MVRRFSALCRGFIPCDERPTRLRGADRLPARRSPLSSPRRRFQHYLDKTVIFPQYRWPGLALLLVIYALRVWSLAGWYIVSYGLAIYILNLFINFLTPQVSYRWSVHVVADAYRA